MKAFLCCILFFGVENQLFNLFQYFGWLNELWELDVDSFEQCWKSSIILTAYLSVFIQNFFRIHFNSYVIVKAAMWKYCVLRGWAKWSLATNSSIKFNQWFNIILTLLMLFSKKLKWFILWCGIWAVKKMCCQGL